ncbi:MAG: hypothetical protein J0H62_03840 [Rhizobiales bacterium]|nr:hypothetical protein [Hyphomicrobiales bacterium]
MLAVGFCAVGYALYIRYLAIEYTPVGLACQNGLQTWLCSTRSLVTLAFNHSVFGWTAVVVAALNFVRPSIVLMAVAIAVGGFGVVLYNVALSALALSLVILSLARPRPEEA